MADSRDDPLERLKRASDALDLAQKSAKTTAEEIATAKQNINKAKGQSRKQAGPARKKKRTTKHRR